MIAIAKRGCAGEIRAARYLRKKGYTILSSNFNCPFGEIDLVAKKQDTLVFVEVKSRSMGQQTLPREAVDLSKQQKIKKASLYYLQQYNEESDVRFDVVEVLTDQKKHRAMIHHIENAFE